MAHINPDLTYPVQEAAFERAYADWRALRERFSRLMDAGNRLYGFPACVTSTDTLVSAIEREIEDAEVSLEDAIHRIIEAGNTDYADIDSRDVGRILEVLESDLRLRLLIETDDPALKLLRLTRSALFRSRV